MKGPLLTAVMMDATKVGQCFNFAEAEGRELLLSHRWNSGEKAYLSCCPCSAACWRQQSREVSGCSARSSVRISPHLMLKSLFSFLLNRTCCHCHVIIPHRPIRSLLLLHPHTPNNAAAYYAGFNSWRGGGYTFALHTLHIIS